MGNNLLGIEEKGLKFPSDQNTGRCVGTAAASVKTAGRAILAGARKILHRIGEPKTEIVVAVIGVPVVAVGHPAVGSVVVPATAPKHTVVACDAVRPELDREM